MIFQREIAKECNRVPKFRACGGPTGNTNMKTMMLFSLTEVILVFFAILFFFLSVYSGEIYLTATVMATRPLFVFILTLLLSIPVIGLFSESFRGKAMVTRATGIVLTVGGVIGVSLT